MYKRHAISLISAALLFACSDTESVDSLLAKAEAKIAQSQTSSAVIDLKNAIKAEPTNGQARFLLGQIYLNSGNGNSAVKELEKALQNKYSKDDVLPLLARAYSLTGENEKLDNLQDKSKTLIPDAKAKVNFYLLVSAIQQGDMASAGEIYKASVKAFPSNSYTNLAKGYLAFVDGEYDVSTNVAEQFLVVYPESPDAIKLLAQSYFAENEKEKSLAQYQKYNQLQPDDVKGYFMLAGIYADSQDFEKAEEVLAGLGEQFENYPYVNFIRALARFSQEDYQQAYDQSDKYLQSDSKNVQARIIAGVSAFQLKNLEQSYSHLSLINQLLPKEHPAIRMYLLSAFQLGHLSEAKLMASNLAVDNQGDYELLTSMGIELYELGYVNEAQAISEKLATATSSNSEQKTKAAMLKVMLDDPTAIADLESMIDAQVKPTTADYGLVIAYLKEGKVDEAIAFNQKLIARSPEDIRGHNLLAQIYLMENRYSKAKNSIDDSLAASPNNIKGLSLLTNYYYQTGAMDNALQQAEQNLGVSASNIMFLKQRYFLRQDEEISAAIKSAYENNKDTFTYLDLYTDLLFQNKEFKSARNILATHEHSLLTPDKYWFKLLFVYKTLNEQISFDKAFSDWVKTSNYKDTAVKAHIEYLLKSKRIDQALTLIATAKNEQPDNHQFRLLHVALLLEDKKYTQAKLQLKEVDKNSVSSKLYQSVEGQLAFAFEDYITAEKLLTPLFQENKNGKLASMIFVIKSKTSVEQAQAFLKAYLEEKPSDVINRNRLANSYLSNSYEKALAQFLKINEASPDNVVINNNIAWLYSNEGKPKQALPFAEKAVELAPTNPDVLDTYGKTLLSLSEFDKSLSTLAKAYRLSKGEKPEIAMNYAEALIETDQTIPAKDILNKLVKLTQPQQERLTTLREK